MRKITLDQLRILLVEPSLTQQKIITGYLREDGVGDVDCAASGAEAIALLRDSPHQLVISAMYLQDMTGTELLQCIREEVNLTDIPFILVSSETHYRYLEPIRQAGAIAILPKPFEPEYLLRALYATLDYLDPGHLSLQRKQAEELWVLIVDDSRMARKHIRRVLTEMGIEHFMEAENGEGALEVLNAHTFDFIVTDYHMPVMDGEALIRHIRASEDMSDIPILMVSSESDSERIAAVQQAGVSAVCDKPFEPMMVKQIIEIMLP